VKVQET